MNRILLIGEKSGKRRFYFEQAAGEAGAEFSFCDWKDIRLLQQMRELQSFVVKIDPPEWDSGRLRELEELTDGYGEGLRMLSQMPAGAFLNHPSEIAAVLDKRGCKKRLAENGVPVTEMYEEVFDHGTELLEFMEENRVGQVFIKPVKGSGAAGVTALRFAPGSGRLVLYTCAVVEQGQLVNTKKMYRLEGREGVDFLDKLLGLDCVIERWYRKSVFQGYSYDLRVVFQGGRIDYILPRLSKGPITNLHLNNHSMEWRDLELDKRTEERIAEVCLRAADCYPGLKSIGMDVLLERGSLNPYIIEMNAQGDLLHRDVYGENRIYKRQIALMEEMMKNPPKLEAISCGPEH